MASDSSPARPEADESLGKRKEHKHKHKHKKHKDKQRVKEAVDVAVDGGEDGEGLEDGEIREVEPTAEIASLSAPVSQHAGTVKKTGASERR